MFIDVGGLECSDGSCSHCSSSISVSSSNRSSSSCCSGTDNGGYLARIGNSESSRDAGATLHTRINMHNTLVLT